jgi:hypothetical protein
MAALYSAKDEDSIALHVSLVALHSLSKWCAEAK